MSSNNPFRVLGLNGATATEADVKKAYSIKLKLTRPDEDRDGFMALQQAYQQARSQAKHNDQNRKRQQEEATGDSVAVLIEEGARGEEEVLVEEVAHDYGQIRYWYDSELDYHFNSSPIGKLIEKTIRWIVKERGSHPEKFFNTLAHEPALHDRQNFVHYSNFLLQRINWEAGGTEFYGDEDEFDPPDAEEELKAPQWLTREAWRAIDENFSFSTRVPENGWEASLLNNVNSLYPQERDGDNPDGEAKKLHDVEKIHASAMEEQYRDQFGSHYDFETHRWVNMAPVAQATRDMETIISAPVAASLDAWREILERDEIQSIDDYQEIDQYLRWQVVDASGFGEKYAPCLPKWLNEESLEYLDNYFGWSHQTANNRWSHDQLNWLHRLIERKTEHRPLPRQKEFQDPEPIDKNSFAYLGYQPLPWLLRPAVLLVGYSLYRLVQAAFQAG